MKKILFSCVILCLIAYSFFFPEITVNASKKGIEIWFHQILPALLPFTILSTVLVKSNLLKSFKGNANLISCLIVMSCGFIFGFPVGAKLSADFYTQRLLTQKQASILAIATNNFSPMYVCGFAIPLLFKSKIYTTLSYVILYFVPLLIVAIYLIFENAKSKQSHSEKDTYTDISSTFQLDMPIMDSSIISGFESLIKICGYIVLFSIVTEIFTSFIVAFIIHPPSILTLLLGNLEITNGIQLLSSVNCEENQKYIMAIQLLSFGGLSGIAQTCSILSDAELSMHKYIIGKATLSLLLTLLSVIYVFFIHSF